MKIVVFLLSVFCSVNLAAQTVTHADELTYYTTISRNYAPLPLKVQAVWGETSTLIMTAQQSQTHRIDNSAAASLRSSSSQNIRDISGAILSINSVNENDNDIALKQNVISFLNDVKAAQETAIPNIITVLLRGADKITPQETTLLKTFVSKGRELQNKQAQIDYLFSLYRSKHNITPDELKKFGL